MPKTKKKNVKTFKNKTAKKKNESQKRFKFSKTQKGDELRGKNGSFLRIAKNKDTGVVRRVAPRNWPDNIIKIFDSLNDKYKNPVKPKDFNKSKIVIESKTAQPKPVSPKPVSPKPVSPKPVSPKPVSPKPVQLKPKVKQIPIEDTPHIEEKKTVKEVSLQPFTKECEELLNTIKDSIHEMDITNKNYQKVLNCVEQKNIIELGKHKDEDVLYPNLDDPNFTLKLSRKKEFNEIKIGKKTKKQIENISTESTALCNPMEFELEPHQMFVRNFLSFQTPYNSLLIFHGLGTGKTCSSITVCEEMRTYYQQIGIRKKIMIVASPVVQENYKLQLFDDRKLQKINGLWNIKACIGNKFIKEVNPMNMKGLTKDKIVKQIRKIIRQSYEFIGYIEFANQINNLVKGITGDNEKRRRRKKKLIKKEFNNRLLVIDEVHNIRATGNAKRTTKNLQDLVTYAENMKLLLLTATPMFNDAKEIIWLINLMNLNDKRFPIKIQDVFTADGNFIEEDGNPIGKELLIQKLTGYVSYVSGEDPFTFPYRIWPYEAGNPHSIKKLENEGWQYPTKQINGLDITDNMKIKYIDLVITKLNPLQQEYYNYIIKREKEEHPILNEKREGIQYTRIEGPLQALNITYPYVNFEKNIKEEQLEKFLIGKGGLKRIMHYTKKNKRNFHYVKEIEAKYGKIFSSVGGEKSPLKKCSSKIYSIINKIKNSEGIILIYSQYIDGGCVPLALALEELGITRYGINKSLFETPPTPPMKIDGKYDAKYIMITGDKVLSPKNKLELKACTDPYNKNGEKVKVIIISKAGSEGLDFRNIRQIHILEPWFNLNRIDQIIGRGVRNKSHCDLPYDKRNVEIYLYGSELNNSDTEAIDLYVYRLAEYKALRIGIITRILKEYAVDCLLNLNQQDMTASKMNKIVDLVLSDNKQIKFRVGYKNNSIICDFMNCEYNCIPNDEIEGKILLNTYSENYIIMNIDKILQRIRNLYKEHYVYEKNDLIKRINIIKPYSKEQINMALNILINDKNEYLTDMLNRNGRLVNIDQYYLFQPIDIKNKHITHLERKRPIDFKIKKITYTLPSEIKKSKLIEEKEDDISVTKNLQQQFKLISTPFKSKQKTWTQSASWAIQNLIKYNNLNKNELLLYALEHLFDILPITEKLIILNDLINMKDLEEEFVQKINIVKQKFIFETNYFIGADFKNIYNRKSKIVIFILDNTKNPSIWKHDSKITMKNIPLKVQKQIYERFVVSNKDMFNDNIGFLGSISTKRTEIIFKIKKTVLNVGERLHKGQICGKGENRSVTLNRINKLVLNIKPGIKYGQKQTRRIKSIYDLEKAKIVQKTGSKDKIPISDIQLCAETELLFRYLDFHKEKGKRWFFDTVGNILNDIPQIPKI